MIATLIILLIIANSGEDALRYFDPEDAKKKIVGAVEDPARAQSVAREVDDQIAIYRQKGADVAKAEKELATLLVDPATTRGAFQVRLDAMNRGLVSFDQQLLEQRNTMRRLMTREEWDKAFGGVKDKKKN